MAIWIIEPHDPLIVRDGRPFGPNPGVQATSLSFPFPSTTTGGVRTRAGLNDIGVFNKTKENIETVKKIKVRGPLLVELKPDSNEGELENWLTPAPGDALLFADKKEIEVKRLVPLDISDDVQTDLSAKNSDNLLLVGLSKQDARKPAKNTSPYWYWDTFQNWLLDPSHYERRKVESSELGHDGPQRERRIHVSIDANKLVGKDGALFGTSGLEFTYVGQHHLWRAKRLALAVAVENDTRMQAGLAGFGGERRIVSWRKSNSELPLCPKELIAAIIEQKACRVLLLTPAYFQLGYRPTWLLEQKNGVKSRLRAIAIQRPQVVSGWDLEHGKPKPTRRLAPAGTVLFLSLEGNDEAIGNWIKEKWMQCVSDDKPSRNDGFGLAAIGTWSGIPEKMQEEG